MEEKIKTYRDLKVGDKVTIMYYTDREPATIVYISKGKNKVIVSPNEATLIGGDYSNIWDISEKTTGRKKSFFLHKNGTYYSKSGGSQLNINCWRKYYDYEF